MIFVENNFINQRNFFRLKNKKIEKNNNKKEDYKNNNIKYLSSIDKQKRTSFISNTSRGNKSLTSINSSSNRKTSANIKKRGITTIKRKKKLKELKDINEFDNINNYDKKIYLKLKTFTNNNNNNLEKSKYDDVEENKNLLLSKLINNKAYQIKYKKYNN